MKKTGHKRILVISDMHVPYQHRDAFAFLAAIKKKYRPDKVVCIGDEIDSHSMSFHNSDPDLLSAGDELEAAINQLKKVYKMFPKVDLVDSNHGSMHYRKGKHHGIPRKYLRDYGEILDAPKGWVWHNHLTLTASDGNDIYFSHGLKKNALPVAQQFGMNFVQGHYHTEFSVQYSSSPARLIWGMTVGCLIDDAALAFEYNKLTNQRPIIGVGLIINGRPRLIPMVLKKNNRWNGEVE